MSETPPPTPGWPASLTLLLVPALVGAAVGFVGERSAVGAFVLWTEPLLAGLGLYAVLALLLVMRRPVRAAALALGLVGGAAALHPGVQPTPLDGTEAAWSERQRDCMRMIDAAEAPITVGLWTHAGPLDPDALGKLLDHKLDVLVLLGPGAEAGSAQAQERLRGERKVIPGTTPSRDVALVVRGHFQFCGGHEDIWEMPLPAYEGGQARALFSLPVVDSKGAVPLLAVALDPAGPPRAWPSWSSRVYAGARHVAGLVRALGPRRAVLVGDLQSPRAFRGVRAHLLGAGLVSAAVPASWPARLGPVPALPLHPLDRVWHGSGWTRERAEAPNLGRQPRRPLVVELRPL